MKIPAVMNGEARYIKEWSRHFISGIHLTTEESHIGGAAPLNTHSDVLCHQVLFSTGSSGFPGFHQRLSLVQGKCPRIWILDSGTQYRTKKAFKCTKEGMRVDTSHIESSSWYDLYAALGSSPPCELHQNSSPPHSFGQADHHLCRPAPSRWCV